MVIVSFFLSKNKTDRLLTGWYSSSSSFGPPNLIKLMKYCIERLYPNLWPNLENGEVLWFNWKNDINDNNVLTTDNNYWWRTKQASEGTQRYLPIFTIEHKKSDGTIFESGLFLDQSNNNLWDGKNYWI